MDERKGYFVQKQIFYQVYLLQHNPKSNVPGRRNQFTKREKRGY